jgi:hypothetical protein
MTCTVDCVLVEICKDNACYYCNSTHLICYNMRTKELCSDCKDIYEDVN